MLTTLILEQLRDAVVVREDNVGIAGAVQVCRDRRKSPAVAVQADLFGNILEPSPAHVTQQVLPSAIHGVFEALRHDLGGLEMPEIDILTIVTADKQVELAVVIVVKP